METEKNICIVIPSYNEEQKLQLQLDVFNTFIKEYPDVLLCFVNDGSSDRTLEILEKVKATYFFRLWYDLYRIRKTYKKSLTKRIR
jgi:glycosyltransferase involved in cell wall biosynthesis